MHTEPSVLATLANSLQRRAVRSVKRLVRPLWMRRLAQRNLQSVEPVIAPGGPVVSLTTFDRRLDTVFYTLETIGAGTLRPSRLVLWIADTLLLQGLPPSLTRLVERGLEVRGTDDVGPHTKYFPQVLSQPDPSLPLVTADDDVLYPRQWLQGLVAAATALPEVIHCYRAHVYGFEANGRLSAYVGWPACRSAEPSHRHFSTGVSGALFPVAMQHALRSAGDGFRSCCPRADDIWLNAVAWRERIPVCQVQRFGRSFFEIPGTRAHGLANDNVQHGGNDDQLRATFSVPELQALRKAR